jgi:hypothetical protein
LGSFEEKGKDWVGNECQTAIEDTFRKDVTT